MKKAKHPTKKSTAALPSDRKCDVACCPHSGDYKAPQSRDHLNVYFWFCLDHVRRYNADWDYYAGMGPEEIEAHIRFDLTWQRPTWQFGNPKGFDPSQYFNKTYQAFRENFSPASSPAYSPDSVHFSTAERAALERLQLAPPYTQENLKKHYKNLVKSHHPDTKGGCKKAEETIKEINLAYTLLKDSPRIK